MHKRWKKNHFISKIFMSIHFHIMLLIVNITKWIMNDRIWCGVADFLIFLVIIYGLQAHEYFKG